MKNNKNKKSVKFQGDMLNFCDFIQVFVFTTNHHLNQQFYKGVVCVCVWVCVCVGGGCNMNSCLEDIAIPNGAKSSKKVFSHGGANSFF